MWQNPPNKPQQSSEASHTRALTFDASNIDFGGGRPQNVLHSGRRPSVSNEIEEDQKSVEKEMKEDFHIDTSDSRSKEIGEALSLGKLRHVYDSLSMHPF